ncbi:MAG: rod shape-determining protein MreC [Muribaculaceae bacterium]|nr:rod shape-determining protein MreC [Muribaculaceae bacterium]
MRRLIEFIIAHSSIFVFVIYVTISIILLLRFNPYQESIFFNSANSIAGKYYSVINNISGYVGLREINNELQQNNTELELQVAQLKAELQQLKSENNIEEFLQGELSKTRLFGVARPVNVTTVNANNYITLDKGSTHGVKEGMGVINRSGVVGIISTVSDNYSLVISILNPKLRLSCKLKGSDYFGSLTWEGDSPEYAKLEELPRHVNFNKGDTIVTSGYSSVFPEGIMIGVVEEASRQKNDNFNALKVKLSTDYFRLGDVCIIENIDREEQNSLMVK